MNAIWVSRIEAPSSTGALLRTASRPKSDLALVSRAPAASRWTAGPVSHFLIEKLRAVLVCDALDNLLAGCVDSIGKDVQRALNVSSSLALEGW